jgi:WD40 repeat protein
VSVPVLPERTTAQLDPDNPWPGLDSFEEDARDYFHGRNVEADDLLRRVVGAPLTVLFGKSGLGKTSLLKAGLFPRLRAQQFLPVHVRLDIRPGAPALVDQIRDALRKAIADERVEAPEGIEREPLWEYLHRTDLELWSEQNYPLTPVLAIDQFEEIFTLGERLSGETERFKIDFGDLAENRIPSGLSARLSADASAAQRFDLRRMPYKLILSLREDFLPHLEGWRSAVPSLGRTRVRLLPMRSAQALSAVHDTAPHLTDMQTARRIVEFVAAAQTSISEAEAGSAASSTPGVEMAGEIEPALLSLFCRGLNERRKRERKLRFDEQLIEGAQESIILDYYRSCVQDLPDRASRFIETELITGKGFRNSFARDDAVPEYLTADQLDALINRRLVRLEERYGTLRIELTHDLLTKAVLERRKERQVEEERAALIARAEEERRALETHTRDARRRLRVAALAVLVCLLFAGVAAWQWRAAERARAEADTKREEADAKRAEAEKARIDADTARIEAEKARREADTERTQANGQRQSAEQQTRIARARELAATAIPMLETASERQRELAVLLGLHAVDSTFSADGTATREAEDALHRAVGGAKTELPFPGHSLDIRGLAFSPDGTRIATCALDRTLRVWNVEAGDEVQRTPIGECHDVAFGVDGIRFAEQPTFGPMFVRDLSGRALVEVPFVRGFGITGLWLSADGRRAAFTDRGTLTVWDAPSNRRLLELDRNAWDSPVALSADGTRLAFSHDANIRIVDVSTKRELQSLPNRAGGEIQLSANGALIAIRERGAGIHVCSVAAATCSVIPLDSDGTFGGMVFSPDGRHLATATQGDRVRVWDTATAAEVVSRIEGNAPLTFSRDGRRLAVSTGDSSASIVNIPSGEMVSDLYGRKDSAIHAAAFDGGATRLATASGDGKIRTWDTKSGRLLSAVSDADGVERMVLNVAGDRVAVGVSSGDWRVWRTQSGAGEPAVVLQRQDVFDVAFSGTRLFGAATAGRFEIAGLKLWDVLSGRSSGVPFAAESERTSTFTRTLSVAVSADQRRVAAGSTRGGAVWDIASGRELLRIPDHQWEVAFGGPTGRWIVAAGMNRTDVWDVETGRKVNQNAIPAIAQRTFGKRGTHVALADNGSLVAKVEDDLRTVTLFDVATGLKHTSLYRHDGDVRSVAFSRDGKSVVVALEDWSVHHHPLQIPDLLTLARTRVKRSLTTEECQTYLGRPRCQD